MQTPASHRGVNHERFRSHNRRVVLSHIYDSGPMGRAEIARAAGLSTQAVSNIIAQLSEERLLMETGRRAQGRGLPPVQYDINPRGGYALGIEIRPSIIYLALLDLKGGALHTDSAPIATSDPETVSGTVLSLLHAARRAVPAIAGRTLGAGIVMPGPFGRTGLARAGTELDGWENTDPAAHFETLLGMPVTVQNDANSAALAERLGGVARGLSTYACIYFGAGIGLGLVSGGQLVAGAFGNAGEIGQIRVRQGEHCVWLERAVSRQALARHLAQAGHADNGIPGMEALYAANDPALFDWLREAAEPLAGAIHIVENLFDPQTVIVCGAMPPVVLDHLIGAITLAPDSVSSRADNPLPRVMRGQCGRLTATRGAAALVLHRIFTPEIAAPA